MNNEFLDDLDGKTILNCVKEVDVESPTDKLQLGRLFYYSGQYINGFEQGVSPIKRFYYKYLDFFGDKSENSDVFVELENGKRDWIGTLSNGKFEPCKDSINWQ